MSNGNKKRRLKKGKLACFLFIIFSFSLLIFCLIFYGIRLVKYYKVYNPTGEDSEKVSLLSAGIINNNPTVTTGDGLYSTNGTYMFKGEEVNNYVLFSNQLFRVLKINNDNSVDLILDAPINNLMWNKSITDYVNSDVHKYINDVFLNSLDKSYLKKVSICTDKVNNISKVTCENKNEEYYVKLLNIIDYLNSRNKSKKTFVNHEKEALWLSDRSSSKPWYVDGNQISTYDSSETYFIRPVITLKADTTLVSGDGTINNPYIVEEAKKELTIGSYVKLGTDNYIIYEENKDDVKMVLDGYYNNGKTSYKFASTSNAFNPASPGTLAYYLNYNVYGSLSYSSLLKETKWYTGSYNTSYKDIYKKSIESKVGTYNIADMKFGDYSESYYLTTPGSTGKVYSYGEHMMESKVNLQKQIKPAICIKKAKIKTGNGTKNSPYELEV